MTLAINNPPIGSDIRKDSDALKEFYSIALAKDLSFVDQASDVLRLGCRYLGLHCGIISYVEGDRYTILHVHAESSEYKIQTGDVYELGITYCKFTLDQKNALGFHHAAKTDVSMHPSYKALKLEAYIGAPTYLNGKLFGTLNFTSIYPRANEFTSSEIYFVQLIAEWISRELDINYRHEPSYQRHEILSSKLETSPLTVIELTPTFMVTKWSEAAELVLGWREEQVMNKAPKDWPIVNQNDLSNLVSILENLRECNENGCAFSCDLRKNNGELISTEWLLTCVNSKTSADEKRVRAHILDITARVNAENELLRKSAFYQDLFQNAPDMYMSLDQAGNIISVNNLCNKILGYKASELIGTPYWNLILKSDVRRIHRLIDVAFLGDVEELEMEANVLKKDNTVIKTHQRIRIIQTKKNMPRELRIIIRDITERKRGQANRLEHLKHQRDEISLEVQHRIKNSLQAVIGMLTVSIDSYPEMKQILRTSIAQIHTISIVNGLIMDGKDDVNLLSLLSSLIDASSHLFSSDIQFNQSADDDFIQMLVADEVISIALVITELLINALKYHSVNNHSEDYIQVNANSNVDGINIEIRNTCANAIAEKESASHIGISMIKSLLPPYGANLNISQGEGFYIALLEINDPVVFAQPKK